jgi:hypothetical protein
MTADDIETVITPIILTTYGDSGVSVHADDTSYARAFIKLLSKRIAEYDGEDRERMVMLACWDWFPGGGTAATTAKRIEAAL